MWLAEQGFDVKMGARPMARAVQEYVKKPLASSLLFGELAGGGKVRVRLEGDRLEFDYESATAPA